MTNKQELWELRRQCHELFDKSIKTKTDRLRKYNKLCRKLGISPKEAHFALLDKEQLLKALELLKGGKL